MSDDAGWISSRSKLKNAGPGTFSPVGRITLDRLTRGARSTPSNDHIGHAVDVDHLRHAVGEARRRARGSRDRAAR